MDFIYYLNIGIYTILSRITFEQQIKNNEINTGIVSYTIVYYTNTASLHIFFTFEYVLLLINHYLFNVAIEKVIWRKRTQNECRNVNIKDCKRFCNVIIWVLKCPSLSCFSDIFNDINFDFTKEISKARSNLLLLLLFTY